MFVHRKMVAKGYEIGDLVWAKMKGYPDWPGKISDPPNGANKKGKHYVYFFGSKNFSWITDDKIKYHSEELLKTITKKKYAFFEEAVEEIKSESKKSKSSVKIVSEEKDVKSVTKASKENDSKESTPVIKKSPKKRKSDIPVKLFSKEKKSENSQPKKSVAKIPKKRHLSGTEDSAGSSKKSKGDYTTLFESVLPSMGVNNLAIYNLPDEMDAEVPVPIIPSTPKISKSESKNLEPESTKSPKAKTIGFIGLGMMGQGMVRNLLNAQHSLWIWNRTPSKCDPFVEMGAIKALTPAEVVKKSDITFCCLSDPHAVRTIMFGDGGVLKGFENCPLKSKGYVEMTSIDAETSVEIAEAVENAGMKYLEAPIIGSKKRADDGTILILGSGDRDLFHDCESCFHAMSNHAYYISCTVGKSASINIITNMFLGTTYAALAEALALTDRIKLSRSDLLEILELRGITSPLVMDKGKAIVENKYKPDTYLKHQQKDLNLALLLSDHCDQPLPVTRAANDVYKHAKQLGCSNDDAAAVYHGVWY